MKNSIKNTTITGGMPVNNNLKGTHEFNQKTKRVSTS